MNMNRFEFNTYTDKTTGNDKFSVVRSVDLSQLMKMFLMEISNIRQGVELIEVDKVKWLQDNLDDFENRLIGLIDFLDSQD